MACIDKEEDYGSHTLQNIAKKLQLYTPLPKHVSEHATDRRAAVLICLFEGSEGELRVILTKRSMKLSSFPGDVALPGGKMDEADADDSATALREAREEIGLESRLVQVVANLDPFLIYVQQYLLKVIPVIGVLISRIEDFKPALNTEEVDAIFDVPLEMFLKDTHKFDEREWKGFKYVAHNFEFESHDHQGIFVISGLTASILVKTASIIYLKSPCFDQHHLPDFQELQKNLV